MPRYRPYARRVHPKALTPYDEPPSASPSIRQQDANGPSAHALTNSAPIPTFGDAVLAHLDSGFNLALWILRDEHLAADAVQEASLKAWRAYGQFRGGDSKSWFLAVVRTCAIDCARRSGREHLLGGVEPATTATDLPLPALLDHERGAIIHQAVWSLPGPLREVLVLREIEGMSYAQIAVALDIPPGTVMSRISRARDAAAAALRARMSEGSSHGVP